MSYLLDTNICVDIIRSKSDSLIRKVISMDSAQLAVSTITVAELEYGVANSSRVEHNAESLRRFLLPISIHDYDDRSAKVYGSVRARLQRQGMKIGSLDTLIASQALAHDMILVTNNMKEFKRVEGLRLENWVELDL
jgi:tRNA(fMet)-specific endonuclease VapC